MFANDWKNNNAYKGTDHLLLVCRHIQGLPNVLIYKWSVAAISFKISARDWQTLSNVNDFIGEWNLIQIDCKQCSLLTNVFQPNKVAKGSLGIDDDQKRLTRREQEC